MADAEQPAGTLRERGYTVCEHPAALVEIQSERWSWQKPLAAPIALTDHHFCAACGARLIDGMWKGGSLDFERDRVYAEWGCLLRWWEAADFSGG